MKSAAVFVVALACTLAGCSTANISARGGNFTSTGAPQAGASVGGGSVEVGIQSTPAAAAIVTLGVFAAMMGAWRDAPFQRAVPEMLEGRTISEVDCTQPIADWSANLRCR